MGVGFGFLGEGKHQSLTQSGVRVSAMHTAFEDHLIRKVKLQRDRSAKTGVWGVGAGRSHLTVYVQAWNFPA